MRKGRAEVIVVGKYRGGGYTTDFGGYNDILSPDGIVTTITRHRGKGTPPIAIVKNGKQSEDTDDTQGRSFRP